MTPNRTLLACASLALALTALPAAAQRDVAGHPRVRQSLDLLSAWLDGQRAYEEIPGVSAAVVHDQNVLWSGASGFSDLARRTPATPSTVYSICSISKLFTSLAVMQLRDQGKLRLDDPVARHLPWFNLRQAYPDAPTITVEGLLTHASGLPREADYPYWTGEFQFPTREQIVERLGRQETLYPAERYFQYSNLGLTLAGEVVGAASGEPYSAYVRRHILDPLGLRSTTTEMPAAMRGNRLATGYSARRRDGTRAVLPFFAARGIDPAAGYASTAEDLARFAAWQFRLLGRGGEEVLKANTLREMQRVHFVDPAWETTWGLGFAVWQDNKKTFVGHGGSCPGYRTQIQLQPNDRIGTVFMSNANGVNSGLYARRMYEIVAPAVQQAVRDSVRTPAPADTALRRYVGSYDATPWGGETLVVAWEDGLAMLELPNSDPVRGLRKLRRVAGTPHLFRRVRDDGELAEPIRFELGPDGRATRYWQFENPYPRLR